MDLVVSVESGVLVRVGVEVGRVQVVSDTGGVVVDPSTEAVVRLSGVARL